MKQFLHIVSCSLCRVSLLVPVSFSPVLLCQDSWGDLAPLSAEDCRGRFIFITPQPRHLFPSGVKYPMDSLCGRGEDGSLPSVGQLEHRDNPFWTRRDVDAVFGVSRLHCSGQENGMRFSLCMRIVLASKLDVEQFLMPCKNVEGECVLFLPQKECVAGTDCWSLGLHGNWSPRLPGTVHLLHATLMAQLQPRVQPGTPEERLPPP